jgi:hypothetical protein
MFLRNEPKLFGRDFRCNNQCVRRLRLKSPKNSVGSFAADCPAIALATADPKPRTAAQSRHLVTP